MNRELVVSCKDAYDDFKGYYDDEISLDVFILKDKLVLNQKILKKSSIYVIIIIY